MKKLFSSSLNPVVAPTARPQPHIYPSSPARACFDCRQYTELRNPDQTYHQFKTSKSSVDEFCVFQKRRSTDFEEPRIVKCSVEEAANLAKGYFWA